MSYYNLCSSENNITKENKMRLSVFTGLCCEILLFLLLWCLNNFRISTGMIKFVSIGIFSITGMFEIGIYLSSLINKNINWDISIFLKGD